MSFSPEVKTQAMVACGRSCCICHKFRGNNMEVHHIKQRADGGEDTFENAIPLCFDCHAEVGQYNPHHPKGIKFSEKELILHRDNWYDKVLKNEPVSTSETRSIDIEVYNALKECLPKDILRMMKEFSFSEMRYPFRFDDPLEKFLYLCEDPMFEYLDKDLEVCKSMLEERISKYFKSSEGRIYKDDDTSGIPREWKIKDEDKYYEAVEVLDNQSNLLWESYCDYIKMCRRKLEITGE